MLKAIIVDDEPYCCEVLLSLLEKYCSQVQVAACYNSSLDALNAIQQQQPDIVFLDVEMPHMNGFQLLENLPSINFNLIFTTSYDQYALKAFRWSAIDYLLKPIDREELEKAVNKVEKQSQWPATQQLELLFEKWKQPSTAISKVALPTMEGLLMVAVDTIISCESDSNYTIFRLKDKQKIIASRTLKDIEEMLQEYSFTRVHHSYLVNINEINKYVKGEGGYLEMSDGTTVDVSRSKKEALLNRLLNHKK